MTARARSTAVCASWSSLIVLIGHLAMGTAIHGCCCSSKRLAYALIALGLNIQFGYGGLFNLAVMGFADDRRLWRRASISMPVNEAFWKSDGPMMLGRAIGALRRRRRAGAGGARR